jgi:hypothetical protein
MNNKGYINKVCLCRFTLELTISSSPEKCATFTKENVALLSHTDEKSKELFLHLLIINYLWLKIILISK